jgi:hypothetical protein
LRLPIMIGATIAGLGLFAGDADAGRWLPTVDNPYCSITTYALRDLPEQGSSMTDSHDGFVWHADDRGEREHAA